MLNSTRSDYYFSTADHIGFYVNILNAYEFPDVTLGGMTQLIVEENRRAYFRVVPITVRSKSSVEQYSPRQRGCLFPHELSDQYGEHYNLVHCLLKCKIRKVDDLCRCMPFFLPKNFPGKISARINCTLADNKCLRQSRCKQNHLHRLAIAVS